MVASLAASAIADVPLAHAPRRILLVLDRSRVWRWQTWLAQALTSDGAAIDFELVEGAQDLSSSLRLLMAMERLVFAAPPDQASTLLSDTEIAALPRAADGAQYDLAIDFTGRRRRIHADRVIHPSFDGVPGDIGAIAAVLARRAPRLGLVDDASGFSERGACALEDKELLTRGLDGVFSRMAGLLLAAARSHEAKPSKDGGTALAKMSPVPPAATEPLAFFAHAIARKAQGRLSQLLGQAPRWNVAWRRRAHADSTLSIPWEDFTPLRGDASRYYADPFVMMRGDTAHVFCEEVPFTTGKGFIAHFTIDPRGNVSVPRPVLERPYHLSYPFVFERDGEIWMIPETSANHSVELYRAASFPDRWMKEATLIDGILADDATLIDHGGKLWMFAGIRDWQASSWEALGLFLADTLLGPWQPHAENPVLLDPAAARPAGALFEHDGALIRPVQDCRDGYGAGLAFARVDRLDETGFAQTILARVSPRTRTVKGLHTYNRAGDVEAIDLFGKF